MQHTTTRSWEWSPSPFANAVVSTVLRIPVLHRVLSRYLLLITFTGRKSGKRYTTPVGYVREGNTVTILTKWFRLWWRNFQVTAPAELLVEGRIYRSEGKALTDEAAVIPLITEAIRKYPFNAQFYGVRMVAPDQPDMDDIRRIAPKVVALRFVLAE